jgi:outer membrane lipoprotein-sorting protein
MKKWYLKSGLLIYVLIAGFFSGCAGIFRSREPLPEIPPETLVQSIQDHASRLKTFRGSADLSVYSIEGYFRGSINISAKMPDSLYMKLEGPLGIDVLTGCFSGDQVLLYSPWEKMAYKGSIQRMQEIDLLPIDMGSSDVVLGMLGLLILDEIQLIALRSITADNRKYILEFSTGEVIWVEPKGPVITRWEMKDVDGETLWLWEGKEYKKRSGIQLPSYIRMTSMDPKQQVTLYYETVRVNRSLKDDWYKMRIPEGVKTIEL